MRRILVVAVALSLGGCAMPRPPRPNVPEPAPTSGTPEQVRPPSEETGAAAAEAERLSELGRPAEAEAKLRDALATGEGDRAELELTLGRLLEDQGRSEEAAVHYLAAASDPRRSAEAWDGIARLRREGGDDAGALRAELHAWAAPYVRDRDRREDAIRRDLEGLSDGALAVLGSETRDEAGHDLVLGEQRGRRERAGAELPRTVVVLAPFSGRLAHFGEAFRLGARIALEERAAEAESSGVAVEPVVIEWRDTAGDLLQATNAARQAVLEDGATAILGPLLSVTSIAAGGVAQAYGVPLLAPTATDPGLATLGSYVLTLDPAPSSLARPLAEFSVDRLGGRRFGVLLPSDGVSGEYEREFREAVEAAGGEVVVSIAFEPGETDFRKLIERIDREGVDAVYIPGSAADLEDLASQLDFYEFQRRVLGNGAWTDPKVIDPGNPALEGAVLAVEAAQDPDSDLHLRLRERVRTLGGEDISRFHLEGYRAMSALLGAIDRGASTGEEIVETLRLRRFWPLPPAAERVELLTYRDGVLGPADWAPGFRLVPKGAADDEAEAGDGAPSRKD